MALPLKSKGTLTSRPLATESCKRTLMEPSVSAAVSVAAARLTRELGKAGERVRISKETPTLIESRIRGEWKHAVDIHSLDQALEALDKDRVFLKAGGVFTDDMIDAYIALKMKEVTAFRAATHPLEYQMYYAV